MIPPVAPFEAPLQSARTRRLATGRAVMALMLREMATTYGRSPGGYIWAVLEPVAGIAVLSFVFAAAFHAPPLGTNFPIFYATGMVPFMMYGALSTKIAQSINFSRQLLAYPSVTYVDALLGRFLLNFLTQILVSYIVFTGLLLIFDTRTVLSYDKLALLTLGVGALGAGVGVMNCFLNSMFPIWQPIWGVINRPLFIVSCIFFLYETIPTPYNGILWYNPLVHIVGLARAAFYPSYEGQYISLAYLFGVSLGLMAFGLLLLHRHHRTILNR
jgi:capsular polysaccharide transport system permease protein